MKAVKITGKRQLSVVEVPVPEVTDGNVLIRIGTSGICGSDIHMWEEGRSVGLIPGHEFGVTDEHAGTRMDLNEVQGAFERLSSGDSPEAKILIKP